MSSIPHNGWGEAMSKFEQVQHGRYIVRVGPLAGAWAAQAYQGAKSVGGRHQGANRDDALEKARHMLDAREAEIAANRNQDGAPTAREYVEAFECLGRLADGWEAMLAAHLSSQDRLITATQLAQAAGYTNWSAANLQYGKLGRRLAEELNYNPPNRKNGTTIWTYSLATSPDDGDLEEEQLYSLLERGLENPHFEWLLRPQVAEALRLR